MKYIKRRTNSYNSRLLRFRIVTLLLLSIAAFLTLKVVSGSDSSKPADYLWQVRSIDTMKVSRDMALVKLYDSSFDQTISREVSLAKGLGANYITIDTPYDEEFLPYLTRWVKAARKEHLNVWYRGNFSAWEGWFGYSKDLTSDDLLHKTQQFIISNKALFKDGDIFDPCPECENSGYWPQPQKNNEYNQFVIKKNEVLKDSFEKINKKVIYNWDSVIGGRAKEVLTDKTLDSLGNTVAIDHYAPNATSYQDYVMYFAKHNSKVVVSEFGAPIPDMHGNMTEAEQAKFIGEVLNNLYKNKNNVMGLNYWVLSNGTTSLYNVDYSARSVTSVLKRYYSPGVIKGTIENTVGEKLNNVEIRTRDGENRTVTDKDGKYQVVVPAGEVELLINGVNYNSTKIEDTLYYNQSSKKDIVLVPVKTDFIYRLRLNVNNFLNSK